MAAPFFVRQMQPSPKDRQGRIVLFVILSKAKNLRTDSFAYRVVSAKILCCAQDDTGEGRPAMTNGEVDAGFFRLFVV